MKSCYDEVARARLRLKTNVNLWEEERKFDHGLYISVLIL